MTGQEKLTLTIQIGSGPTTTVVLDEWSMELSRPAYVYENGKPQIEHLPYDKNLFPDGLEVQELHLSLFGQRYPVGKSRSSFSGESI